MKVQSTVRDYFEQLSDNKQKVQNKLNFYSHATYKKRTNNTNRKEKEVGLD